MGLNNPAPPNVPKKSMPSSRASDNTSTCSLRQEKRSTYSHRVHRNGQKADTTRWQSQEEEAFQAFAKANNMPLSVVCPAIVCDRGTNGRQSLRERPLALATAPFRLALFEENGGRRCTRPAPPWATNRRYGTAQNLATSTGTISSSSSWPWSHRDGPRVGPSGRQGDWLTVPSLILLFNIALLDGRLVDRPTCCS